MVGKYSILAGAAGLLAAFLRFIHLLTYSVLQDCRTPGEQNPTLQLDRPWHLWNARTAADMIPPARVDESAVL